jgi:hypothetical protein
MKALTIKIHKEGNSNGAASFLFSITIPIRNMEKRPLL